MTEDTKYAPLCSTCSKGYAPFPTGYRRYPPIYPGLVVRDADGEELP